MPTIAIDFDGTITNYKGYKGKGIFDDPLPKCREEIKKIIEQGWTVIINTTRAETWEVQKYLNKHKIPFHYINYNPTNTDLHLSPAKVIADVYLDDRNVEFNGNWEKAIEKISKFKIWWA